MTLSTNKRKRQDEETEPDAALKSPKYWFEDGNIVLRVETTLFRVHRSMLAHHSNVFMNIFSIPQPHESVSDQDESIEGCPTMTLEDKALDVEYMLSVIYDNFKTIDIRGPMAFDDLAAILRLGKKYDIEHFCTEGLRRIRAEFPSSYEKWKLQMTEDRVVEIIECENYLEKVINFAHELSIDSVLPSAYFRYVIKNDSNAMFEAFFGSGQDNGTRLPPDAVKACLHGRESFRHTCHTFAITVLPRISRKVTCLTPGVCNNAAMAMYPFETFWSNLMTREVVPVSNEGAESVCDNCAKPLEKYMELCSKLQWQKFPVLFSLGDSWDTLKDFDA